MMIKPSINELDKIVDNRYSLVCAVAKRARELALGDEQLVVCDSDKEVTIAANELYQGKIRIVDGEEPEENAKTEEPFAEAENGEEDA